MIHEDQLPPNYPYAAMWEQSEVRDGVRMFPDRVPVFIQILAPGQEYHPRNWTPWLTPANDDRDMTLRLAVNKFVRDSGGFPHGQELTLRVYHYDLTTPTHPSGRPQTCELSEFKVTRP